MTDLFTGDHPVLSDDRTGLLFDTMVQHGGPVRLAKVFREYARQAAAFKLDHAGQQSLAGGGPPPPEDLLRLAIENLDAKDVREEEKVARIDAAIEEKKRTGDRGGQGLFRSFVWAKERLDELRTTEQ